MFMLLQKLKIRKERIKNLEKISEIKQKRINELINQLPNSSIKNELQEKRTCR